MRHNVFQNDLGRINFLNKNIIPAVSLEGVCFSREGREILKDIVWSVGRGECAAIVGANGAGKSTLLALLAGYLWPQEGSVSVLGETFGEIEIARVRERIGVIAPSRLPEIPPWMTVAEIIASGFFGTIVIPPREKISRKKWKSVAEMLRVVGLEERAEESFGELSTGEKMRTLLARAMIARHDLLLLDEPTAGLDLRARVAVIRTLEQLHQRQERPAIIMVTHHLEDLPQSVKKVLLLKQGRIYAQGNAKDVLTSKNLSAVFDCKVEVARRSGHYYTIVRAEEWDL